MKSRIRKILRSRCGASTIETICLSSLVALALVVGVDAVKVSLMKPMVTVNDCLKTQHKLTVGTGPHSGQIGGGTCGTMNTSVGSTDSTGIMIPDQIPLATE